MQRAIHLLYEELESYKKPPLPRPEINWKSTVFTVLLWLVLITVSVVLALAVPALQPIGGWLVAFVAVAATCLLAKKMLINAILLYQKYAPERIRQRCVYEPTCSNYMIQAIEKYGVIRGVWKGTRRLLRCHYPNGGVDNP